MEWADTARENSQHQSGPRQNSAFLIWITANRRSWTAFVHPSPSVTIDTPLMNLFGGTAPSRLSFNKVVVTRYRIFLENRQLAAGTINGRLAAVRGSMDDLLQYDDSPMRPQ